MKSKIKNFKIKNENRKPKKSKIRVFRVCVRVKDEKLCYFQMCYTIECHKMPFECIFSPVECKIPAEWCNCPPKENQAAVGL